MNILVTGGTGFVGSHLAAALIRRGDRVRVFRRPSSSLVALDGLDVEHFVGDILNPQAVGRAVAGCDCVFHVAAVASYWRARQEQVRRVNVEGTRMVMQACLDAGVRRVVHTSSVAAVGISPDGNPADENTTFDALSSTFVYAESKYRAEIEVQRAVAEGLSAVIVNPAAVIGPGDHHMISSSIVAEFARRYVPFVSPGGMAVVDIDAVVQGHLAAAERGRAGERYILGGENLSHREIAAIICELVDRRPPRWTIPAWLLGPAATVVDVYNRVSPRPPILSGEQVRLGGTNFFFDSRKAVRELDYQLLPFRAAAARAYRWYQDHGYL